MSHLNYAFAMFPTRPQVRQLRRILWEGQQQFNRGCNTISALNSNLRRGNLTYVLEALLSVEKDDTQSNRQKAIAQARENWPKATDEQMPVLYDLHRWLKKVFPLEVRHTDLKVLAAELAPMLAREFDILRPSWQAQRAWRAKRKEARKADEEFKEPWPKSPSGKDVALFYALKNACLWIAEAKAKDYVDRAFPTRKGTARSGIRFEISGGAKSRLQKACNPSPAQRQNGHTGHPRRKPYRLYTSFGYQVQAAVPLRQTSGGWQVALKGLSKGMEWVPIVLHRPIPEGAEWCHVNVQVVAGRWTVTFALAVPDAVYALPPANPNLLVGVDPGASTALTCAILDTSTGEYDLKKFHWSPLEKSADKLENLQRKMSRMRGPDRRTGQKASNRWKDQSRKVGKLQARIARQRKDTHHKVSRYLAGHGYIALGAWEPPRRIKEAPGPKGIVRARRSGRDRGIATLRAMTAEKAARSGAVIVPYADEKMTTRCCSACGQDTGPKNDRSIRHWVCQRCGASHDRDENAARNILTKTFLSTQEETEAIFAPPQAAG